MNLLPQTISPMDHPPRKLDALIRFTHPRFGEVTTEFHPGGLPVRHAITHGGLTAAGAFSSALMGRTMPWQSFNERELIHHLNFEPRCQGYLVQPCVTRWRHNGIPYIYFPDAIAEFERPIVLECKTDHSRTSVGEDTSKYRMAREIYRALGWDFQIITGAQLTANPKKLLNHKDLIRNQRVNYDLSHELTVRECMRANGDVMLFSTLADHLAGAFAISPETAKAIVFAMAARRIVRFNLEKRITPVSPVQLVTTPSSGMKFINFWEKANG